MNVKESEATNVLLRHVFKLPNPYTRQLPEPGHVLEAAEYLASRAQATLMAGIGPTDLPEELGA